MLESGDIGSLTPAPVAPEPALPELLLVGLGGVGAPFGPLEPPELPELWAKAICGDMIRKAVKIGMEMRFMAGRLPQ
jgi:hypothetical protein